MIRRKQMTWCAGALLAAAILMTGCSGPDRLAASQTQTETSTEAAATEDNAKTESSGSKTDAPDNASTQETTQDSSDAADTSAENVNNENKRIVPLPETLSINNLKDCTIAASFENSDIFMDGGALSIRMTVYDYEKFDAAEISQMKKGDTLVIDGKEMLVDSLEEYGHGIIRINGGLEEGGCDLWTEGEGVYQEALMDSGNSYYPIGETVLPVAEECVYYDQSNLDKPQEEYYAGDLLTMSDSVDFSCHPNNSIIRIENGKIAEITKIYTP